MEAKLKVLIVFAHAEPKSFCAAMKDKCVEVLTKNGHEVKVSDLYQMNHIDPLGKTNFKKIVHPEYFKPQREQSICNANNFEGYEDSVKAEHEKFNWASHLLFIFPLYWFHFPGIMKNWIDKTLSMGFAYGTKKGNYCMNKLAMLIYATGETKQMLDTEFRFMYHIMIDQTFGFCSIESLEPFPAFAVAHISQDERKKILDDLGLAMENITKRPIYKSMDKEISHENYAKGPEEIKVYREKKEKK